MVLSWKEWFAFQHFREDTPGTPYVNLHIVLLPCEHNLRRSIVSRRDISSHLWVLDACKAKVADFQVTILVDKDVAGLQIAVDDPCRVYVFQAALSLSACLYSFLGWSYQDLVEEVLDELFLERSGSKETMKVGTEKLSDEVAVKVLATDSMKIKSASLTCPRVER